jgi:nitrite reductase/ring-hydroxylating ferredoxin subunit
MDEHDPQTMTIAPDRRLDSEQPRWRQDFPIDWPEDEYVARREFTKFMVLTSLAFAVGQLWIVIENFFRRRSAPALVREIAKVNDLLIGGALLFDYPKAHQPAVLIRMDADRFVAYGQKCTHLSCPVIPRVDEGRLLCLCHEGSFDLATGRPVAGGRAVRWRVSRCRFAKDGSMPPQSRNEPRERIALCPASAENDRQRDSQRGEHPRSSATLAPDGDHERLPRCR